MRQLREDEWVRLWTKNKRKQLKIIAKGDQVLYDRLFSLEKIATQQKYERLKEKQITTTPFILKFLLQLEKYNLTLDQLKCILDHQKEKEGRENN
ncbi:hypothetical protein AF435_04470 [Listeria monocytogenes]|uniref:Uncharacterized protein n=1 Tax=Listeria monocytogenes TaxID=1639 RepID=A0AAN2WEL5_LISMN|nr:hypothetical protein [Listeria monocytogenes]EAC3367745.1 hypothetical protein [Listeria monocytogenes]EAC7084974.1 hypothetical protein [Listeria monocytogenes]EAC8542000.1 hypothetical protein [Listeria monocytogenes]EAC8548001.1 hypothetical protein [Listeria monocytogenes]